MGSVTELIFKVTFRCQGNENTVRRQLEGLLEYFDDVSIIDVKCRQTSTELRELGLSAQLTTSLTKAGVGTASELAALTEQYLREDLAVDLFSYRRIIRALALRELSLAGSPGYSSSIELLELSPQAYKRLRKMGFSCLTSLTRMSELEAYNRLGWFDFQAVREALSYFELDFAPLANSTTVAQVDNGYIASKLASIGVKPGTRLASFTPDRIKLLRTRAASNQPAATELENLIELLRRLGWQRGSALGN